MLRHNQHFRGFMGIQQFFATPKSKASSHLACLLISQLKFNYNGVRRSTFLKLSGTTLSHFSRDTKELRDLGFMKVIDSEIFINPRLCWSGSDRIKNYRIKCFDQGVAELDPQVSMCPVTAMDHTLSTLIDS